MIGCRDFEWNIFQNDLMLKFLQNESSQFSQILSLTNSFGAGSQGDHLNFNPTLLANKSWLVYMRMKQKKKILIKKIQNGRLKKCLFSKTANSWNFLQKFCELVLEFVGLIDEKGIDVAQPICPA